jgi:hypothetical protein
MTWLSMTTRLQESLDLRWGHRSAKTEVHRCCPMISSLDEININNQAINSEWHFIDRSAVPGYGCVGDLLR